MLKPITPGQRMEEVQTEFIRLGTVAWLTSQAGCVLLYIFRHGDFPPSFFPILLFNLFCSIGSGLIVGLVWVRLVLWLSRVDAADAVAAFRTPNTNPRPVERFLEGWWANETVLAVLTVVFRVAFCVALYELVGPSMGLL